MYKEEGETDGYAPGEEETGEEIWKKTQFNH